MIAVKTAELFGSLTGFYSEERGRAAVCTVTVIQQRGGWRLVTSRDESRARPAAIPPAMKTFGGVHAICPKDPEAGGTWVAVNEHGLTLCILNANPTPPEPKGEVSRGAIIPAIGAHSVAADAVEALAAMDLGVYAPFHLVLVDGQGVRDARWVGGSLAIGARAWSEGPACFVSSGLGDHLVAPRLDLWRGWFGSEPSPETQDAYHAHRWPEKPEISVWMEREAARTVSVTTLEVLVGEQAVMQHRDDNQSVSKALPLRLTAGSVS